MLYMFVVGRNINLISFGFSLSTHTANIKLTFYFIKKF